MTEVEVPSILGASGLGEEEIKLDELKGTTELAELTGYHAGHLRKLLAEGKIRGTKIGGGSRGNWVSTLEAVEHYQQEKEGGDVLGQKSSSLKR